MAAMLAQAPAEQPRTVAVFATSKRPGVEQYIATLTARVHALMQREGVAPLLDEQKGQEQLKLAGFSDPRSCQGGRACVNKLALILGAKVVVVGVDVAKAGSSLAVILEAVPSESKTPMLTTEWSVPISSFSDDSALAVTLFARQLKEKLDAERPKPSPAKVEDAPVVTKLEPVPPVTPPPELVLPPPETKSSTKRTLGWVSGAGAVAAGGVAGALAILGSSAHGQIRGSIIPGSAPPASNLPESELRRLEGQANGMYTGALISGIAAGALAVISIYCFASDP